MNKYFLVPAVSLAILMTSCCWMRPYTVRLPGVWAATREGSRTWMVGVADERNPDNVRLLSAPDNDEVQRRNEVRRYASLGDNTLLVELAYPDRHGRRECMLVYSPEKDDVDVIWTPFKIERAIAKYGGKIVFVTLP